MVIPSCKVQSAVTIELLKHQQTLLTSQTLGWLILYIKKTNFQVLFLEESRRVGQWQAASTPSL
jgi:hypothetical protein